MTGIRKTIAQKSGIFTLGRAIQFFILLWTFPSVDAGSNFSNIYTWTKIISFLHRFVYTHQISVKRMQYLVNAPDKQVHEIAYIERLAILIAPLSTIYHQVTVKRKLFSAWMVYIVSQLMAKNTLGAELSIMVAWMYVL